MSNLFSKINIYLKAAIISLLVFVFFVPQIRYLNNHIVGPDASESLLISFNFAKYGQFSLNDSSNHDALYATNQREPLPVFLWAQSLSFFSDLSEFEDLKALIKSKQLVKAKYINLVFLFILLVSLVLLVFELPTSLASTSVKIVSSLLLLISLKIYGFLDQVNVFVNDLHTTTFLLLLTLQIFYFFETPTKSKLIFIGLVYGLLCLTKATFFYSGIIVFFAVIAYQFINKLSIKTSLIVFISALIITVPWLMRNYIQTGQTAISGRGPETFVDRTYEEIYNDSHFIGLWYAYSPDFLKPLATKLTGYSYKDRNVGGRLQHSTRPHEVDLIARKLGDESMAINSHFKAGIWMTHVYDEIYAKVKNPVIAKKEASKVYKQFALKEMFAHPLRHLKHTLIFAWRGIWILNGIDGRTLYEVGYAKQESTAKQAVPFLGFISLFFIFIHGLNKKNHLLLLLTIVPLAAYIFNSFFSHNLPRYGNAFLPIWLLCFAFVVLYTINRIKQSCSNFKQRLEV